MTEQIKGFTTNNLYIPDTECCNCKLNRLAAEEFIKRIEEKYKKYENINHQLIMSKEELTDYESKMFDLYYNMAQQLRWALQIFKEQFHLTSNSNQHEREHK